MDFNTDVPSTVIDTDTGPSASGGGIPNLTEPVDTKHASLRDDLESVFKEDADKQKVEEQPKDEKPADDEKQRSEEHTSELQSLMSISYAVFCLTTKKSKYKTKH